MSIQEKLFSFDGRLRRRDWWLWSIVVGIVGAIVQACLAIPFGGSLATMSGFGVGSIVAFLVSLAFLFPQAALSVKRGHDRGRPTNVILGAIAVIVICEALSRFLLLSGAAAGGAAGMLAMSGPAMIPNLIVVVIAIWFLVDLGILDGTPGPNEYGPSPKGIGGEAATAAS